MSKIAFNPYIVGNPIKTKDMFFGREDDFGFVIRKIGEGRTNQIIVFCGERRSGKTSILFQILGGRLGKDFLPVLVDMQILAGIKSDYDLFRSFLRNACSTLKNPDFTLEKVEAGMESPSVEALFSSFFTFVETVYPGKIVLFLLDEYELIEAKIRDGTLSENSIHYLAGLLEGGNRISFIFTGSTNLEDRKADFWKSLLGKSIYRKISYLSQGDTRRLITEPLQGQVSYPEEVTDSIYRLTGGQPFYTQVICQNIVDHLIEEERDDPSSPDLRTIVSDIVDNPLPQMIYSWNNQSDWSKVTLACAGALIEGPADWIESSQIYAFLRKNRLIVPFEREKINILLEEAYHREFLEKRESHLYCFKMDLFRRWIKREHSLWQVAKEVGLEFRRSLRRALLIAAACAGVLGIAAAIWFFGIPALRRDEPPIPAQAVEPEQPEAVEVALRANRQPFRVMIDGTLNLTSEGQDDESVILVPAMEAGRHTFAFFDPAAEETIEDTYEVSEDYNRFEVNFTKPIPKRPAAEPAERPAATVEAAEVSPAVDTETVEEEPAAPKSGGIFLNTDPPGAFVLVDGEVLESPTPVIVEDLGPGVHGIGLMKEGYREMTLSLEVKAGETVKEEVSLVAVFGSITLDIRPTAKVYLDGEYLIETPYAKSFQVQAGKHVLTLRNESLGVDEDISFVLREGDEKHFSRELQE